MEYVEYIVWLKKTYDISPDETYNSINCLLELVSIRNEFLGLGGHIEGSPFSNRDWLRNKKEWIKRNGTTALTFEEFKEYKKEMVQKEIELKTPYEWCVEANLRVLDINEWPLEWYGSKEKHFFEFPTMPKNEFLDALIQCKVKYNSLQRKTDMYLEYRMYGLVPYNLSPIQQGIQFGHAVVEYQQNTLGLEPMQKLYNKWATKDKTFIILNGGTTNRNKESFGTLNKHLLEITKIGVKAGVFFEPDLGDQLTAFVFLVDERVFNRELYPEFQEEKLPYGTRKPSKKVETELEERNETNYQKWVEKIGGPTNAFLREYLKPLRLA